MTTTCQVSATLEGNATFQKQVLILDRLKTQRFGRASIGRQSSGKGTVSSGNVRWGQLGGRRGGARSGSPDRAQRTIPIATPQLVSDCATHCTT